MPINKRECRKKEEIDLFSLFRRSSSIGTRNLVMRPHDQGHGENDDEYDSDEEEPQVMSKEKLLDAIRQKKEIIGKLRCQAWSMKRKRRTLKVAQRHLQRQEAKVSRVHLYKVEAVRRFTIFARWLDNMKIYLIPWEAKIKRIESHFGSVVSSYFTFLRWVLGVNVTMTIIMLLFVIIPEWLADSRGDPVRYNRTRHIKVMPDDVRARADELNTVWDFGGYFQYSLLFYGFYSSETYFGDTVQYRVPIAYFIVNLFVLGYSFFTILRKMAANARSSKLTGGKAEQYVFNWKTFAGWDYSIGNAETAGNFIMANVIKFREAIAEYNVNVKKKFACVQIILRLFANMVIFTLLALSVWAILAVSQITEKDTFIKQNAVSITVSFITLIFPNIFELIGKMERYHPRFALRLQLARVLCLYIVNYYTLIVSLMFMLNTLEAEMKANEMTYHLANGGKVAENTYYEVSHQRMARQILQDMIGPNHLNDTHGFTTPSPPEPPSTTMVMADFGPIIVHNPKVIMSSATNRTSIKKTIVTTMKVGKHDWGSPNRSDHDAVVLSYNSTNLNLTDTSSQIYAQPRLAGNYDDLCWETLIGQEISKLVTMDLLMTIAAILVIDFFRGLWVRYCNTWWFWNLECTFPEYGEFKVAENVLHLVNNQGMIWLGLFFVPMLPALNNIKLIILMYIRGWAVMTCNVPARQIFRASRSSNFYLMLLLLMLFLCTLPVGYVIASKKPSKNCGPFGRQERFYSIITEVLQNNLNRNLVDAIRYMVSPGIVIPILLLLLLIIYFLFALVRGLREANTDLSNQLMHERTEEKKKIFELAGGGRRRHNGVAFGHDKKKQPHFESSDDESHTARSLPRSIRGGQFVPSLGYAHEEKGDQQRLSRGKEKLLATVRDAEKMYPVHCSC
uniref:TMC domain-containing protein n=1 Tax=Steinernema glaseri TaxID=37863 RepID=A0A1I8AB08_9BILA